jgi:hypothetical protein
MAAPHASGPKGELPVRLELHISSIFQRCVCELMKIAQARVLFYGDQGSPYVRQRTGSVSVCHQRITGSIKLPPQLCNASSYGLVQHAQTASARY